MSRYVSNPTPQSDNEATNRLALFSDDQIITKPAIKEYYHQRAMGETIESAYNWALQFMIRRAG